jgi:hypothetical protein
MGQRRAEFIALERPRLAVAAKGDCKCDNYEDRDIFLHQISFSDLHATLLLKIRKGYAFALETSVSPKDQRNLSSCL